MRIWVCISAIWALVLVIASPGLASARASSNAVLLEITEGDTSFIVDSHKAEAWWVVGECKREIPIQKTKKATNTITSEMIIEQVTLGNRQVTLKQQFRFNLADTPSAGLATVEVYNSLRGGWSAVPVRLNDTCALDVTCQSRMEAPKC